MNPLLVARSNLHSKSWAISSLVPAGAGTRNHQPASLQWAILPCCPRALLPPIALLYTYSCIYVYYILVYALVYISCCPRALPPTALLYILLWVSTTLMCSPSSSLPCALQCFLPPWFHTDCQRGHTLQCIGWLSFVWTFCMDAWMNFNQHYCQLKS